MRRKQPEQAQHITLSLGGYHAAAGATVLWYGQYSRGISISRAHLGGAVTLSAYSLTELIPAPRTLTRTAPDK